MAGAVDLLAIGDGIDDAGIARDAAGRGLSAVLRGGLRPAHQARTEDERRRTR